MGLDDYVESRCDECDSPLTQLRGEWYCPRCAEDGDFQLVPDSDDFAL